MMFWGEKDYCSNEEGVSTACQENDDEGQQQWQPMMKGDDDNE